MMLYSEEWRKLVKIYKAHKRRAIARGLPFTLTLNQWTTLWAPHWEKRKGLMMCRILDMGGYEPGNVYIGTAADNYLDKRVVATWHQYWHAWSARNVPLNL